MTVQTINIPSENKKREKKQQEDDYNFSLFTWTLEQYQDLFKTGALSDDDDVELIFGHIIKKAPINTPHASTIRRLIRFFKQRFPDDAYEITSELPINLPNQSQPKPDCFIAVFDENFYEDRHPTVAEIFVVIEVSDTTLNKDRTLKMEMCGLAGVKEYWIVNIVNRQIEVHVKPNLETGTYASVTHYLQDDSFESPFVGNVEVKGLLPSGSDPE